MRTVIQRVKHASVTIDGVVNGKIDQGFLLLVGIKDGDTEAVVEKMADKIAKMRIFDDENGKMREITNQDEFFTSLREAKDYAYEIVGKKWFYTKRKLFGIAFGIDKEAKIKYISVPEKEKKNILKK